MEESNTEQNYIEKRRGILLTTWLVLIFFAGFIGFLNAIFTESIPLKNPNVPIWIFYIVAFGSLLYAIFAVFVFYWKKWAIFAFTITVLILFAVNIPVSKITEQNPFVGLIGAVILVLLCLPKWKMFE